jgi:threonine/homoserine/homoserine lactone efflux protein
MTALPFTPAFVLASVAITLAPGPDILYVLAKGIAQGRRAALIAATGFCSGLTVHTAAAACGLSALLVASATAFTIVKLLGATYLIYLGIRAILAHGLISLPENSATLSSRTIFAHAFLMNVLNPKVALFFLAFLPQFVRTDQGSVPRQFILFGVGFGLIAFVIFSLVGFFSAALGKHIRTSPAIARFLDRIAGVVFILLGFRLAFFSRFPT